MYLKDKDDFITVRVPRSTRDLLLKIANRHGMNLSAYVRFVLSYHLQSYYFGLKYEDK